MSWFGLALSTGLAGLEEDVRIVNLELTLLVIIPWELANERKDQELMGKREKKGGSVVYFGLGYKNIFTFHKCKISQDSNRNSSKVSVCLLNPSFSILT